jgi:hypothetical protein
VFFKVRFFDQVKLHFTLYLQSLQELTHSTQGSRADGVAPRCARSSQGFALLETNY